MSKISQRVLTAAAWFIAAAVGVYAQAPAISSQPAAQAVAAGSSAVFSVTATGASPLTYQWYLNGVALSSKTASSISVSNVQSSSTGNYSVAVTNSAGTVISGVAALSLSAAPAYLGAFTGQQLVAAQGSSGTITFNVSAYPAPTYQWFLNGVAVSGQTSATLTLTNIQPANAGTYTATATNAYGSLTSDSFPLTVESIGTGNGPISITTSGGTQVNGNVSSSTGQLTGSVSSGGSSSVVAPTVGGIQAQSGLMVDMGTTATLTVTATGSPAPTYQWYFGGSALVGQTNASLVLTNVQPSNAGSYTVTATNASGSVTSAAVAVSVDNISANGAVSIAGANGTQIVGSYNTSTGALTASVTSGTSSVAPQVDGINGSSDLLLQIGASATLSTFASGSPAPTFQWYKNGTAVSGATNSTFTIGSVATTDAGTYTVTATNSSGSATSGKTNVSVTSLTSGSGPLTIATSGGTLISGTVSSSGTLSGSVTAGVASGSSTAPSIASLQSNGGAFVNQGSTLTLQASASGSPAPTFQWYLNGALLPGQTSATLTIANVQATNAGTYTVTATNSGGSVTSSGVSVTVASLSSSGTLSIAGANGTEITGSYNTSSGQLTGGVTTGGLSASVAPQVGSIVGTANLLLQLGTAATLSTSASGSPAPTYQWFKNGTAISGATNPTYSIASVATTDAGTYSVTATNSNGTATSNSTNVSVTSLISGSGPLTIATSGGTLINGTVSSSGTLSATLTTGVPAGATAAPSIASLQSNGGAFVNQGSTLTLQAAASGSPAPTFQWYLNGNALSGQTSATLSVANVQATNAGTYTVVATNASGSATSTGVAVTVASISSSGAVSIAGGDGTEITGSYSTSTGQLSGGVTTGGVTASVAPQVGAIIGTSDLLLQLGATATLSTSASGSPAPTYQWFKGGKVISGATNSTYTITGVATTDAGTYTVTATNSNGSATTTATNVSVTSLTSGSGPLTVATSGGTVINGTVSSAGALAGTVTTGVSTGSSAAPSIVALQSNGGAFINQGSTLSLQALASGSPAPTFQWYLNGALLAGQTSATLTIANVQATNAGSYTVVAKNSNGSVTSSGVPVTVASISSSGALSIAGGNGDQITGSYNTSSGQLTGGVTTTAPNAVAAPQMGGITSTSNLLLQLGTSATLSTSASGSPAPAYQWFKNGAAISGATNSTYAIASVATTDAGTYSVTATNSNGTATSATTNVSVTSLTSGSGPLTIATSGGTLISGTVSSSGSLSGSVTTSATGASQAPTIAALQSNGGAFVNQGATLTLQVSASGSPAPTYQWYLNGFPLAGQTSSTLTVSNVQATNSGTYTVVAANASGSVTSAGVPVTVASISSSGALSIAGGNGTEISGNYNTSSGQLSGGVTTSGAASVVAPQLGGITSSPALLVQAGTSASMSVSASGNPTPTLQWFQNGTAISGATNSTYTIASAAATDAGNYTVTAKNSAGSTTSAVESVSVTSLTSGGGPAVIVTSGGTQINADVDPVTGALSGAVTSGGGPAAPQISSVGTQGGLFLNQGATATLSATSTGNPAPTFQWFLNGVALSGQTSANLTLSNVQATSAGLYTVRVTNSAGSSLSNSIPVTVASISSSGQVSIAAGNGTQVSATFNPGTGSLTGSTTSNASVASLNSLAPSITSLTTNPAGLMATVGSPATLSIAASGNPPPSYQWFKNGAALANQTNSTFSLASAQTTDAGTYTVSLANSAGSVTSGPFALTVANLGTNGAVAVSTSSGTNVSAVLDPSTGTLVGSASAGGGASVPAIAAVETSPNSLLLNAGSSVTISVFANATPAPTYQWFKNGVAIPGYTSADLPIIQAQASDAGTYIVYVTNSAGSVASAATVVSIVNIGSSGAVALATGGGTQIGGSVSLGSGTVQGSSTTQSGSNGAVPSAPFVKLVNFSSNGYAGPGANAAVAGFVVSGTGGRQLLVRAIGPGLAAYGVSNTLPSPVLTLSQGSNVVATNSSWIAAPNSVQISQTSALLGAFALNAAGGDDALLATLNPGSYTATVTGATPASGQALMEIYDAGDAVPGGSRVVNFSSLQKLGPAGALSAGFTVSGNTTETVLVRALGPTLQQTFGISAAIPAPVLTVLNGPVVLATNRDYRTSSSAAQILADVATVGAFGFATGAADSAVVLTLSPGSYTVQVGDATGATGTSMVEIYEVP